MQEMHHHRDLVARVFCNKFILQGEADEKSHGEAAKLGLLILAWAGRLNKMHESHGSIQIVGQVHGSVFMITILHFDDPAVRTQCHVL